MIGLGLALSVAAIAQAGGQWSASFELVGAAEGELLRVEIGEPFELVVRATHGATETPSLSELAPRPGRFELEPGPFTLDEGWVWFGGTDFRVVARSEDDALLESEARLEVAALEPRVVDGEDGLATDPVRPLPPLTVLLVDERGGERELARADGLAIEVDGVLAPGEIEPRPLSGLPTSPLQLSEEEAWQRAGLVAVLSLALLVFGARVLVGGRDRLELAPAEPTPLERVAELRRSAESDRSPRAAIERAYSTSALIRDALGEALDAVRPSATDEEWLAGLREDALAPNDRGDLARTFERLARIKYAGEVPSAWATEELIGEAERWVARADELARAHGWNGGAA